MFTLNHIKNFIDPAKINMTLLVPKMFQSNTSIIKYAYEISVYCTILLSSDSKCNDTFYSFITSYIII